MKDENNKAQQNKEVHNYIDRWAEHGHGHKHHYVHSAHEKKAVINRISKEIGHLEAVEENDEEAIRRLNQAIEQFMK